MAARKLTVYKKFEQDLVEFETEYGSELVQCDTPTGMKAAKASRKDIRDTRSNLEDLRKETKAPALAKCKQIDEEAAAIKERLDVLFVKFDTAIKAVENKKEIAKQKELDEAHARLADLEARETAIKAKEIELGLREPDPIEDDDGGGSDASDDATDTDSGSAGDSRDTPDLERSKRTETDARHSTICEPHIKAASERLAALKKIRALVESTDPQDGDINEKIAWNHDKVLAELWDIVDEYQ